MKNHLFAKIYDTKPIFDAMRPRHLLILIVVMFAAGSVLESLLNILYVYFGMPYASMLRFLVGVVGAVIYFGCFLLIIGYVRNKKLWQRTNQGSFTRLGCFDPMLQDIRPQEVVMLLLVMLTGDNALQSILKFSLASLEIPDGAYLLMLIGIVSTVIFFGCILLTIELLSYKKSLIEEHGLSSPDVPSATVDHRVLPTCGKKPRRWHLILMASIRVLFVMSIVAAFMTVIPSIMMGCGMVSCRLEIYFGGMALAVGYVIVTTLIRRGLLPGLMIMIVLQLIGFEYAPRILLLDHSILLILLCALSIFYWRTVIGPTCSGSGLE